MSRATKRWLRDPNNPIREIAGAALLIAGIKVSLIAAFFMHLKVEKKVIHGIFYTAILFALILLLLVLPDIGNR